MKKKMWLSLMLSMLALAALTGCMVPMQNGNNGDREPFPGQWPQQPQAQPSPQQTYTPPAPVQPVPQQAQIETPIAYTVVGSKARAEAVTKFMATQGFSVTPITSSEVMGQFNGKPWPGVTVTSDPKDPGTGIFVPVSDKALKQGLCSDQVSLLTNLPRARTTFTQGAPPAGPTAAPCIGPSCWGRNPIGKYITLNPLWGYVKFVVNYRDHYFTNVVSVKWECWGGKWIPVIVIRNPTVSFPEAYSRINSMRTRIEAYLTCTSPQVQGKQGGDGSSCFEVEFDLMTGQLVKPSEGPPNCPF